MKRGNIIAVIAAIVLLAAATAYANKAEPKKEEPSIVSKDELAQVEGREEKEKTAYQLECTNIILMIPVQEGGEEFELNESGLCHSVILHPDKSTKVTYRDSEIHVGNEKEIGAYMESLGHDYGVVPGEKDIILKVPSDEIACKLITFSSEDTSYAVLLEPVPDNTTYIGMTMQAPPMELDEIMTKVEEFAIAY